MWPSRGASAPLEDHPVVGSDPEHPGLVRIYKGADTRHLQYENAWHCDATWRECPQMGAVLRCVECPPVGGDMIWVEHGPGLCERLPEHVKTQIARPARPAQHRGQLRRGAADRASAWR